MAKPRKITESSSIEDILAEIYKVDEIINAESAKIKELKIKKRTLNKWLKNAESKEAKKKDEETLNRIVSIIKEKGITVDDIEKMIDK